MNPNVYVIYTMAHNNVVFVSTDLLYIARRCDMSYGDVVHAVGCRQVFRLPGSVPPPERKWELYVSGKITTVVHPSNLKFTHDGHRMEFSGWYPGDDLTFTMRKPTWLESTRGLAKEEER